MRFWMHSWRSDKLEIEREFEGQPLDLVVGNGFRARGVERGDIMYVAAYGHGNFHLLARFVVVRVVPNGTGEYRERVEGRGGTPLVLGRMIAPEPLRGLLFGRPGSARPLAFREAGRLDIQALRTFRELPPETAEFFDSVLAATDHADARPELDITEFLELEELSGDALVEGVRVRRNEIRYERSRKARELCVRKWGARCAACGFDFGQAYGELGEGFIEVHHIRPISEGARRTRGDEDLIPLCPNCHRMIHRRYPCLAVAELKKLLKSARKIDSRG